MFVRLFVDHQFEYAWVKKKHSLAEEWKMLLSALSS